MQKRDDKPTLLIATHNPGKLEQIRRQLLAAPVRLVSLADLGITTDVEETGSTFRENAILKATAYSQISGLPTVADDSGLEIDALDGAPGVHSARWAGPHATAEQKRAFLLKKLRGVPTEQRTVQFTSIMALVWPGQDIRIYEGHTQGLITHEPRGIGPAAMVYTPVFLLPELGQTIAEFYDQHGHFDGHRAQAAKKLALDLTNSILCIPPASQPTKGDTPPT